VARAGAPKPDITSVDALKHTLLAARLVVYADPAKGGVSGVYFASVLNEALPDHPAVAINSPL